MSNHEPHFSVK